MDYWKALVKTLGLLPVWALLASCVAVPASTSSPHYRCEQNLQFTARFNADSVTLEGGGSYDLLFRKPSAKPDEYDNSRMSVQFNLGPGGTEAVLRYPLLPLALRCVRTN